MENPTPFQIGPQELINLVLTWESLDDPLAAMQSLGDPLPIELRYRDVQTIQTAQPHHQIHLPIVEEPNLKAQLLIHVRSVTDHLARVKVLILSHAASHMALGTCLCVPPFLMGGRRQQLIYVSLDSPIWAWG